jgi:hypothetical protein
MKMSDEECLQIHSDAVTKLMNGENNLSLEDVVKKYLTDIGFSDPDTADLYGIIKAHMSRPSKGTSLENQSITAYREHAIRIGENPDD